MIDHKHKFIFIHVPKCAGTSIERALGYKVGAHKNEKGEIYPHPDPQHWNINGILDPSFCKYHTKITGEQLDKTVVENYYKFTFVRNPWDKLVSWYHHHEPIMLKSKTQTVYPYPVTDSNFRKWIRGGMKTHWDYFPRYGWPREMKKKLEWRQRWKWSDPISNLAWLDNSYDIEYDFIGRFENLHDDYEKVCNDLNIPVKKLPHHTRSKHRHYTEYYDDETKQIVAEKYAKDIEYFGYEFGHE